MRKVNLENVSIVLARPLYSGNVGAVARAMKNMELKRLVLADPQADWLNNEARQMACDARDVLENAILYPCLEEAVADVNLVVGTTRRTGLLRDHVYTPRGLAEKLIDLSQSNKIAILFGNEITGLENEEIRLCQWLVRIPTNPEFKSLNLAQAAMIICYELYQAGSDVPAQPDVPLADVKAVESMYQHMKDTLLEIGFLDKNNPERIMFAIRRILGRAGLEERDVRIFRGISRQIAWYVRMSNDE
jgi:tRNA/rRNA methyltransferase